LWVYQKDAIFIERFFSGTIKDPLYGVYPGHTLEYLGVHPEMWKRVPSNTPGGWNFNPPGNKPEWPENAVIVPGTTIGASHNIGINLTDESIIWDGFAPVRFSVRTKAGQNAKWRTYDPRKFDLAKMLNRGWVNLAFWGSNGIVSFPAVERRGKTGGGLGNKVRLGVFYPQAAPTTWVVADRALIRNNTAVGIHSGLEFGAFNGKTLNSWQPVSAGGFDVPAARTRFAVREAARFEDGKYYPAARLIRVNVNTYGKATKLSFRAGRPPTLNLRAGMMYSIDGGAPVGPVAKGAVNFEEHAGKQAVFWMAATGRRPETARQAGVIVPAPT
jgi:hypothetical protein